MKAVSIVFLWAVVGFLPLLSTGCASTEEQKSNVRLLMPGTDATPLVQRDSGQGFYQPPGNPQFNTARDQ
jgi:hypothetical protein